jgi:hypothetical protein
MTETASVTSSWPRRQKKRKRRSPRRPGMTIREFAEDKDSTEPIVRGLVKRGQLEFVDVNGVMVATPRAHAYWRETFGESN